jgi:hypothetical protein
MFPNSLPKFSGTKNTESAGIFCSAVQQQFTLEGKKIPAVVTVQRESYRLRTVKQAATFCPSMRNGKLQTILRFSRFLIVPILFCSTFSEGLAQWRSNQV